MLNDSDATSGRKLVRKKVKILLYVLAVIVVIILLTLVFAMQYGFQSDIRQEISHLKSEVEEMKRNEEKSKVDLSAYIKTINDTVRNLSLNESAVERWDQVKLKVTELITKAYGSVGWHKHRDNLFYKIVGFDVTHDIAEGRCNDMSATLASGIFRDRLRDNVLLRRLGKVEGFWVGYSRSTDSGEFEWSDGGANNMTSIQWAFGEPTSGYRFAAITYNLTSNGYAMRSYNDTATFGFICERDHTH